MPIATDPALCDPVVPSVGRLYEISNAAISAAQEEANSHANRYGGCLFL